MIFNVTTNIVEKEASVMDLLQMQSEIHQGQMSLLSMDNISTEAAITMDKVKAIIEKIKKFIKSLWKHVIITIRKKLRGEHKCVVSDDHIESEWIKKQQVTLFMNKESDIDVLREYHTKLVQDGKDADKLIKVSKDILKLPSRNTKRNLADVDTFFKLHESNLEFIQVLSSIIASFKMQDMVLRSSYALINFNDTDEINKTIERANASEEINTKYASLITGLINTAISEFPKNAPTEAIRDRVNSMTAQYSKWADKLK